MEFWVDFFNAPFLTVDEDGIPEDTPTNPEFAVYCGEGWATPLRPGVKNPLYNENDPSSKKDPHEIPELQGTFPAVETLTLATMLGGPCLTGSIDMLKDDTFPALWFRATLPLNVDRTIMNSFFKADGYEYICDKGDTRIAEEERIHGYVEWTQGVLTWCPEHFGTETHDTVPNTLPDIKKEYFVIGDPLHSGESNSRAEQWVHEILHLVKRRKSLTA